MRNFRHLWSVLILLAICLGLLAAYPASLTRAQAESPLEITHIETADFPQVQVFVAAPGGTLPDPATLQVTDAGMTINPAEVEVADTRVGVAVAIVIDISRSMRGRGMPTSVDRLQDAREQAIQLARALDPTSDLISIFVFNRTPAELLSLGPVDGGAVENLLSTAPQVQAIPDKPGGPLSVPTQEDYREDDYAYAALSDAVGVAIDTLTMPPADATDLRDQLAAMQKVVVVFSDSCDDALDAIDSVSCEIPADVRAQISEINEDGDLSIVSVGVGVDDPIAGQPQPPRVREEGFAYNAQFALLERFAAELPDSSFFQFYAPDEAAATGVREAFQNQVLADIVQRGNQLVLSYTAPDERGVAHEVVVSSAEQEATATYDVPAIAPEVEIRVTPLEESPFPRVGLNIIRSQQDIAQADYFINDNAEPIIVDTPPFALDTAALQLSAGTYTATVQVTDLRGQVSDLSAPVQFTIDEIDPAMPPVAPAGTVAPFTWQNFLIENAISIIIVVVLLFVLVAVLLYQSSRPTPVQTDPGVDASQRLTKLYSGMADYKLVVRNGRQMGSEFPIDALHTYIGADRSRSDIVLDDDYVSGQHASIQREAPQLYVVDMGSSNGVTVNGQRIPLNVRTPLNVYDKIGIANVILECIPINAEAAGQRAPAGQPSASPGQHTQLASEKTVTYDEDRHGR